MVTTQTAWVVTALVTGEGEEDTEGDRIEREEEEEVEEEVEEEAAAITVELLHR